MMLPSMFAICEPRLKTGLNKIHQEKDSKKYNTLRTAAAATAAAATAAAAAQAAAAAAATGARRLDLKPQ
ncbi:hypothetical protein Emed_004704 [Eimeria media]